MSFPFRSFSRSTRKPAVHTISQSQSVGPSKRSSGKGPLTSFRAQRKNAGNYAPSLPPHMFAVMPFASTGHQFVTSRAQARVQDFGAHLNALQSMQAYYAAQRAKAPSGKTTPQVQQDDWKLAEEILNVLTTFPEFQQLPQQLRDSIEALKPLLGQSGLTRYQAWTEMCRTIENLGQPNSRTPSTNGSAGAAAVPPSLPPRATKCDMAKRSLMELRDRFDARVLQHGQAGRPSLNEWAEWRQHVADILSSPDINRHFPTFKERLGLNDLSYFLNQQPASLTSMWNTWILVKSRLPATGA